MFKLYSKINSREQKLRDLKTGKYQLMREHIRRQKLFSQFDVGKYQVRVENPNYDKEKWFCNHVIQKNSDPNWHIIKDQRVHLREKIRLKPEEQIEFEHQQFVFDDEFVYSLIKG